MLCVKEVNSLFDKMDETMLDHSEHVACLCYAMGQEIDCPSHDLELLWFAGMLHEIGKLDINKSMNVDGKQVDMEEFYPVISKAMLKNINGFDEVEKIIIQHKENYDGSGFPYGLKGTEIDTLAKVLRIADFYDHARQAGKNHDEACLLIRKYSDIYFPRRIITPFIKSIIKNELQFEY